MSAVRLGGWVLPVAALVRAPAVSTFERPGSAAPMIAAENAQFVSRIEAEAAALTPERAPLARVLSEREQLEDRLQRIDRQTGLTVVGREFAVRVRSEQRALPRPNR